MQFGYRRDKWMSSNALTLPYRHVQANTTLTHLELSGNVIDYDGITALSEALTENEALRSLHIK